jgi:hypothetical protein
MSGLAMVDLYGTGDDELAGCDGEIVVVMAILPPARLTSVTALRAKNISRKLYLQLECASVRLMTLIWGSKILARTYHCVCTWLQ